MEFWQLVDSEEQNMDAIGAWLDVASPQARMDATRTLSRRAQRALFAKAGQSDSMVLEDLVPTDRADLEQVIHHGWNTLPLPGSQRRFQKRFCRPTGETERLFGYNEAGSRWLIGPGYFVALDTEGKVSWEERGSLVVDYFQVPDADVVEGWPAVKANSKGLQYFVYHRTRDFMRKVSTHVSIGAAYKNQKSLDHYFMLCREDPA
jgi:hypothetical protein